MSHVCLLASQSSIGSRSDANRFRGKARMCASALQVNRPLGSLCDDEGNTDDDRLRPDCPEQLLTQYRVTMVV